MALFRLTCCFKTWSLCDTACLRGLRWAAALAPSRQAAQDTSIPCFHAESKCRGTIENSNKGTVFAFKELGGSRDTLTDVSSHSHIFHVTDPPTSSCRVREGEQRWHLCLGLGSYLFSSGLFVFQAPLLLKCNLSVFYGVLNVYERSSNVIVIKLHQNLWSTLRYNLEKMGPHSPLLTLNPTGTVHPSRGCRIWPHHNGFF